MGTRPILMYKYDTLYLYHLMLSLSMPSSSSASAAAVVLSQFSQQAQLSDS